jgi:hypothetical protein
MNTSHVHKNYRISVHAIPDAVDSTLFVPRVDISLKDGKPILAMMSTQPFAAKPDAEKCGFEMGKNWIDERLKASEPTDRLYLTPLGETVRQRRRV